MPRQHRDRIAEPKNLRADSTKEQLSISAGQIPTSDPTGKKHIAPNQHAIGARQKTETARGMTRDFEHLKLSAEKFALRRFLDKKVGLHRLDLKRVTEIAKEIPIRNHRRGIGVTTNRTLKLSLNFGYVGHVIEVPVRQEQQFDIEAAARQPIAASIGRVEKDCSLRSVKEVAIRLENPPTKRLVFHNNTGPVPGSSGDFECSASAVVLHRYCRPEFK